jgi:hypothetical protein
MVIYTEYPAGEDLFVHLHREPFQPLRYRYKELIYIVISDGEYHLNDFSYEGTLHQFFHNGTPVLCELEFSGGTQADGRHSRYAGPITIYIRESDGKYYMRPKFEFDDGRFEKVE